MYTKRLQWIESVLFFIISNIIMLLGADFPPPIGFSIITLLSGILSILQFFYTDWILKCKNPLKTFFTTIFSFSLIGLMISILFIIFNTDNIRYTINDALVWILIITLVFGVYGIIYWSFNHLIKFILNKPYKHII